MSRLNGRTHGLRSAPSVFRDTMPPAQREAFEALVTGIARAEGVSSPLDLGLIRDFVTAELLEQEGRAWLLRKGLILAEAHKREYTPDGPVDVVDVDGKEIADAVVPGGVVDALERLARLKQRVHERLRAKREAGEAPGGAKSPLVVKLWQPSPDGEGDSKTGGSGP